MFDLYMYGWSESHNEATLSYMEDAVHPFLSFKDVVLIAQAGHSAKPEANVQLTELLTKWKEDEETNAATLTPSKKRHDMNALWNYYSHEVDVSKEFVSNFNFPKKHLISHSVKYICWYRSFQQYSAKKHEEAHNMNLKDSWNASNHNLNYLPQVITFQHHIPYFHIRELNPQALPHGREIRTATCNVFSSSANQGATLRSQSYAAPEFMRPQNCRNGKHPDPIIKVFKAFLDNPQGSTPLVKT